MEHIRINSISVKRFFLLGIVMLSGYLGVAQNAYIEIVPYEGGDYDYYELEYREKYSSDTSWIRVDGIEAWVSNGNGVMHYINTPYTLTDLLAGTFYEVRARSYREVNGEREYSERGVAVDFMVPFPNSDGIVDDVGPIFVYSYGLLRIISRNISETSFDVIFAEKERDAIKKEE